MRLADPTALREPSVRRVLAEIRQRGRVARVDIADATGLSPATVTAASADLIARGMIVEASETDRPQGRGRPPVQLSLAPDAVYTVGAKLADRSVTAVILDFCGEAVAEGAATFDHPSVTCDELLAALARALDQAYAKAGFGPEKISALGLGVPGFIDVERGLCLWSPVLEGAPIDLGARLAERFPFPIFIDNDANLATLAEMWFGLGKGRPNFLVVTIEHGVGLGVVLGGRLFRGAGGAGSEFGHTKAQPEGALCRCGQRGCIEAYVADYALVREARTALGRDADTRSEQALLDQLFASASEGAPAAGAIFDRAGRILGIGLANLVNIFDPPLIILAGARMRHQHLFAAQTELALATNSLPTGRDGPVLQVHRWGDQLWARGAGALALDGLLSASA